MNLEDKKISVVYVDDSKTWISKFSIIVDEFPNVNVVGTFTDAENALEFCAIHLPKLAIVDIEMPVNDGIWLSENLKKLGIEFVLLTTHNHYASQAYKLEALHYIAKPLSKLDFAEILKRYQDKVSKYENANKLKLENNGRIYVNTQKQIVVLQFNEIVYAKAEGSYTYFQLVTGNVIVSGKTLKTYINALLQNASFVKIHRAYVINQDHLESINKKRLDMRFKFKTGHEIQIATFKRGDWLTNDE